MLAEIGVGAGRTAGVRAADTATADRVDLPGPGEAGAGTVALLDLLRRGGRPQLMLPVAGDVRGLPPGRPHWCRPWTPAPRWSCPIEQVVVVPDEGHWRVYPR